MWDELSDQSTGLKREEELRSTCWKAMIRLGSRTRRFQGTRQSAWEIIHSLDLEILPGRVDPSLPFHETPPGKTLLRSLRIEFKWIWARMRKWARRKGHALSTSSTLGSIGSAWSLVSIDPPLNSSHDAIHPVSDLTEGTTSGCSAHGRRETLLTVIASLTGRLTYQMADITSVSTLRETIGIVLKIAQMIEVSYLLSTIKHRS